MDVEQLEAEAYDNYMRTSMINDHRLTIKHNIMGKNSVRYINIFPKNF